MKMTRLEWRYLQKVALDHPYFDTHKLPLTEKEAKAIVEENIQMTGKEFVDSIYSNLGMTRPEEKKERFAWLHSISEMVTVPPIRKIAIALLVLILMTVFFTATPTGRAIAESMVQYFATLFEDGSVVMSHSDTTAPLIPVDNQDYASDGEQQENQSEFITVNTFNEFTERTGKTPYILQLPYTQLYYIDDADIGYLEFHSTYVTSEGKIVTYQIWDIEYLTSDSLTGYSAYEADESVYYSVEENGDIYVIKAMKDSVLTVFSKGDFTLNNLLRILKILQADTV